MAPFLFDKNCNVVVEYTYDDYGYITSKTGSLKDTVGTKNPYRYRSYRYDEETGLYYLNARYYNPEWGRFISADSEDLLSATMNSYNDKNLFAYCDADPICRVDQDGRFWDVIIDIVSIAFSIGDVIANPTDPLAWGGLGLDIVCAIAPGVTGGGAILKASTKADDVIDTAKTVYKTADKASDIKKATGSYEIIFKSGKNYVGKGGFNRAIQSAKRYGEPVQSIKWQKAANKHQAFVDEYFKQLERGVNNSSTYNKIWSPGKKYYEMKNRRLR